MPAEVALTHRLSLIREASPLSPRVPVVTAQLEAQAWSSEYKPQYTVSKMCQQNTAQNPSQLASPSLSRLAILNRYGFIPAAQGTCWLRF